MQNKRLKSILWGLFLSLVFISYSEAWAGFEGVLKTKGLNACEKYRPGHLNGIFAFGTMGATCQASPYGDALRASLIYEDFLVDGNEVFRNKSETKKIGPISKQTQEYVAAYRDRIVSLIEKMAIDFYQDRLLKEKRKALPGELDGWVTLIQVIGFQESRYTHFQLDDGAEPMDQRMRILVGDPDLAQLPCAKNSNGKSGLCLQPKKDEKGRIHFRAKGMYQILGSAKSQSTKDLFDLVQNIQNGMIHIYDSWARIIGVQTNLNLIGARLFECRGIIRGKNGIIFENAIRAAYGVYNGGEGSVCRFHKSDLQYATYKKNYPGCEIDKTLKDKAMNEHCLSGYRGAYFAPPWVLDQRVLDVIRTRPWQKNRKQVSSHFAFDLNCLKEGGRYCLRDDINGDRKLRSADLDNRLFEIENPMKGYCVLAGAAELMCVENEEYIPCLRNRSQFHRTQILGDKKEVLREFYTIDRLDNKNNQFNVRFGTNLAELCGGEKDGVFVPSELVALLKTSAIYKTPNLKSKILAKKALGTQLQIINFEIAANLDFERWYRVSYLDEKSDAVSEGYVYGGNESNHWQFLKKEGDRIKRPLTLPPIGESIVLKKDFATINPATAIGLYEASLRGMKSYDRKTLKARSRWIIAQYFMMGPDQHLLALVRSERSDDTDNTNKAIPFNQFQGVFSQLLDFKSPNNAGPLSEQNISNHIHNNDSYFIDLGRLNTNESSVGQMLQNKIQFDRQFIRGD